jgi:hypothetical protein
MVHRSCAPCCTTMQRTSHPQMLSGKNLLTAAGTQGGQQSSRLGKISIPGVNISTSSTTTLSRQSTSNLAATDTAPPTGGAQQGAVAAGGSRLSALLAQYDSQAGDGGGHEEEEEEDWLDRRDRGASTSGLQGDKPEGGARSNK